MEASASGLEVWECQMIPIPSDSAIVVITANGYTSTGIFFKKNLTFENLLAIIDSYLPG
jgi:hypothetical protein